MGLSRITGVVASAVLALAACGGGGDGGDADDDGMGPLAELMGWGAIEPAEQRRQELEREQAIAECMRAEGWEYEPVDWSAQMPETSEEDMALFDDGPEAFGEKYGYGIARNYELYEAEGIESGEGPGMSGEAIEDPNQDYVSSLSGSEMEDYYATLHGDPEIYEEQEDDDGVFVSPPLEDQGCWGEAQLAVYGEDPSNDPEIQERMNEYWEGQQDDPRLDAANEEWADCMGDEIEGLESGGEPVTRSEQLYQVFETRKMELMGLESEPFDEDDPDAWTEDTYTVSGDEDGNQVAWVGQPEPISDADLEQLRSDEIAMWKLDFGVPGGCRDHRSAAPDRAGARRRADRRLPRARRSCGRARRGFLRATPRPDDRPRPASLRAARRRAAVVRGPGGRRAASSSVGHRRRGRRRLVRGRRGGRRQSPAVARRRGQRP